MNRKKVILIVAGAESFLLGLSVALFSGGAINLKAFIGIVLAIGIVGSAAIAVAIKKFTS